MAGTSLEGTTLGRYRVLELLGRGGMAWVYRAYHPHLDRYVAVKVLRSDLVEDQEFLARFHREARAVATLRHPHIVQVFDFDTQDDLYYMVMEYLEGDSLKMRLDDYRVRGERMPLGEVGRVMQDLLDGLAYAHGEGMIHRDLKPSNVLLTKRGRAILGDFGIARMISGAHYTATGALMGTPEYMAPEQGLKGRCDARSDIYAMGVILYEMLTQQVPFEAETPLAVLMKHVNDPLPLPRERVPQIPIAVERVVLTAMAKEPEDRYVDAGQMAAAVETALEQASIEVPARVSQAQTFTTPVAPSESVRVLSGAARAGVVNAAAVEGDTDITLQRQWDEASASPRSKQERRRARREVQQRSHADHKVAKGRKATTTWQGLFLALGIAAFGNLLAITLSSIWRNWAIFEIGWPMELFLVGSGLFVLMAMTRSIWLSIPAGLITVNGALFAYTALTTNWHHWAFLWIVEVWVIAATVVLSITLKRESENARTISRLLGWSGSVVAALGAIAAQGGALVLSLARRLLGAG